MGFLNNRGNRSFFRTGPYDKRKSNGSDSIVVWQKLQKSLAAVNFCIQQDFLWKFRESHMKRLTNFRAFIAKENLVTGGTGAKVRPVVSCKGTTCQYGLLDSYALSEEIYKRFYEGYRDVVLPHKFKIAVGGCPNNCVKPNLNDVGIIGQRIPKVSILMSAKDAKNVRSKQPCPNKVAKVVDGKITIDETQCRHCGRCVGKCPFHTIEDGTYGYKIYVGGRWGKKVSKGRSISAKFLHQRKKHSMSLRKQFFSLKTMESKENDLQRRSKESDSKMWRKSCFTDQYLLGSREDKVQRKLRRTWRQLLWK